MRHIVVLPAIAMVIMGLVMLIMIRALSNAAIEYDITRDLRRSQEKNARYISNQDGRLVISDDFLYESDHIHFLILDTGLNILAGAYPEEIAEEMQDVAIKNRSSRSVDCGGQKYYVRDMTIPGSRRGSRMHLRGLIKKADADSHYGMIELVSYLCIVGVLCVILACEFLLYKQISKELRNMCRTAENIGSNLDLSQRMACDNQFTEIATLVRANNRMLDQMEQTFRMQEQFTSDVAHELRTPVSVVMAQCQHTKERATGREDFEEALDVIYNQSKKIDRMITQLLNLSRLDQNRVQIWEETIDLAELTEFVCEARREQELDEPAICLCLNEAVTAGDVSLIVIVIQNLVSNAAKFSKKGGSVRVSTGEKDDWAFVRVEDDGIGIAPENLERIFRRFYRCDSSRNEEGFGLGLPLSEKIAQKHGGRIAVSSEEGKGSAFTLYLPKKPGGG